MDWQNEAHLRSHLGGEKILNIKPSVLYTSASSEVMFFEGQDFLFLKEDLVNMAAEAHVFQN